jgi:hypothetical protein
MSLEVLVLGCDMSTSSDDLFPDSGFSVFPFKIIINTIPFKIPPTFENVVTKLNSSYFSCYFDGAKGKPSNIFFTTGLLMTVLTMNIILYLLSWYRMHQEGFSIFDCPLDVL